MTKFLPLRANQEWLKKAAKDRLKELQATSPQARLSDAQQALAQEYGFANWQGMMVHVEVVREKLQALIPPHQQDEPDVPADDPELATFLAAIRQGEIKTVTSLLGSRPKLATSVNAEGTAPLHLAAQFNDPQLGLMLLCYGADPYAKVGGSAHTALSWGVTCRSIEFVQTLIRLGVKPDLFVAAGLGDMELLHSFFLPDGTLRPNVVSTGSSRFDEAGNRLACPPETDREKVSDAFCMACRNGQVEAVQFLLTKQPDFSFRGFMGAAALHWAYFSGVREVIAMVEEAGADSHLRDHDLQCLPRLFGIAAPASWGFLFLVQRQIERDPELVNYVDGRTSVLHVAAQAGQLEVVRFLLEHGASPTLRDHAGRLASELARENRQEAVATFLEAQ